MPQKTRIAGIKSLNNFPKARCSGNQPKLIKFYVNQIKVLETSLIKFCEWVNTHPQSTQGG